MAENIIKKGFQTFIDWVYSGKMVDEYEEAITRRQRALDELRQYYEGRQRRPLKVSPMGKDYNVLANMAGIIVSRSVSMLVGAGVDFNTPDEAPKKRLEEIYEANRGDIFLHDLVQFGSIYGTEFIKIIPNGREYQGKIYPRLVALNPLHMLVITAQDDIENVLAYVNRWNDGDDAWREITEKREGVWYVRMEKAGRDTHGKWEQQGQEVRWEYEWSPIHHAKNLPSAGNVYGMSDIEGIIELQDRYNAGQSDINVIIGNNAFPLRYVKGGKLPRVTMPDGQQVIDISPAKILEFQSETAQMGVAEMQSDLSSSRAFVSDVRRDIFDIAFTVDTETLRQNAHQITNFGLRVMYKDEIAKNNTKQMLYGTLLREVNRHLLEVEGMAGALPGEVVWGDPLPVDPIGEITALEKDMQLGIVSKKTMSQIRNYDYNQEQENIAEEKQGEDTLGGALLASFMAGRGQ